MIDQEKLKQLAKQYGKSNPRYIDYSLDTIRYGVKTQTGFTLNAQEMHDFFYYLTGYQIELNTIEQSIANTPNWMKSLMEK
jgi:hypothetical protein